MRNRNLHPFQFWRKTLQFLRHTIYVFTSLCMHTTSKVVLTLSIVLNTCSKIPSLSERQPVVWLLKECTVGYNGTLTCWVIIRCGLLLKIFVNRVRITNLEDSFALPFNSLPFSLQPLLAGVISLPVLSLNYSECTVSLERTRRFVPGCVVLCNDMLPKM